MCKTYDSIVYCACFKLSSNFLGEFVGCLLVIWFAPSKPSIKPILYGASSLHPKTKISSNAFLRIKSKPKCQGRKAFRVRISQPHPYWYYPQLYFEYSFINNLTYLLWHVYIITIPKSCFLCLSWFELIFILKMIHLFNFITTANLHANFLTTLLSSLLLFSVFFWKGFWIFVSFWRLLWTVLLRVFHLPSFVWRPCKTEEQ